MQRKNIFRDLAENMWDEQESLNEIFSDFELNELDMEELDDDTERSDIDETEQNADEEF